MADQPRTRQEIYEQIRRTSKEEFIAQDMQRLGFWGQPGQPGDPAEEIRRRGEISRELTELRRRSSNLYNEDALLKELRQRRMADSKRRQQETKARRARERVERAAAWARRKGQEIGYLGEGVSGALGGAAADEARLRHYGLPLLRTPEEVAGAMGITVGALRFLAFSRKVAPITHYVRFRLPKKTGGERLISAPMPRLKRAQGWVLSQVLGKVAPHEAAHGFVPGRSIVSNARPHLGQGVIVNVDLKDFFPTVSYRRVKGVFRALGYGEAVAAVLALLCTEPDVEEVELDGRRFYVALTERHLPQGAPTSPALTNLLCRRLDRRLTGLGQALGFTYTRYADDLTFSAARASATSHEKTGAVGELLKGIAGIVGHEGFVVHPDKTRVLHRGRRQEVTGIVVNEALGVPRDVLRRFRATLFQIEKDGPVGKRWGQGGDVIASCLGFANYVRMVDPDKGAALLAQVQAIVAKHGWQARPTPRRGKPGGGAAGAGAAGAGTAGAGTAAGAAGTPGAGTTAADTTAGTGAADAPSSQTPGKAKKKWWKLW